VVSTDDISPIEKRLGREAVEGHRTRPDGTDLRWKQLGVLDTLKDAQLPFFIQWLTTDHPSTDGKSVAKISKIEIAGSASKLDEWLDKELPIIFGDIEVVLTDPSLNNGETGLIGVTMQTPNGEIYLD